MLDFNDLQVDDEELIAGLDAALNANSCGPSSFRETGDVPGGNLQGFIEPVDIFKKFKYTAPLTMTVAEYDKLANDNKQVCYNVGTTYELMHNCFVLSLCGLEQFDPVFRIFSSVYENVALAGASPANLQLVEFLSVLERSDNMGELVVKCIMYFEACGYDLSSNKAGYSAEQYAQLIVMGAALNIAIREWKKGKHTQATLNLVGEAIVFVPLCAFMRAFSKGDLDWNTGIAFEDLTMKHSHPGAYELLKESVLAEFLVNEYDNFVNIVNLFHFAARAKAAEQAAQENMY